MCEGREAGGGTLALLVIQDRFLGQSLVVPDAGLFQTHQLNVFYWVQPHCTQRFVCIIQGYDLTHEQHIS